MKKYLALICLFLLSITTAFALDRSSNTVWPILIDNESNQTLYRVSVYPSAPACPDSISPNQVAEVQQGNGASCGYVTIPHSSPAIFSISDLENPMVQVTGSAAPDLLFSPLPIQKTCANTGTHYCDFIFSASPLENLTLVYQSPS